MAVSVQGLSKVFGEGDGAVRALSDVSISFAPECVTALMGPSGSGKSTLLHCAAGLESVTSGSVRIGGEEVTTLSDRGLTRLRRERMGFVFQAFNLLPMLTAWENIVLPLRLAGRRVNRKYLMGLAEQVGIADRLQHRPAQLSGGQKQRVAIVRAVAPRPVVLFADEPTGALDTRSSDEVLGLLRGCSSEQGCAVVLVTHDPAAAAYADRVVRMCDGVIVSDTEAAA